jgi:hypothetical protein
MARSIPRLVAIAFFTLLGASALLLWSDDAAQKNSLRAQEPAAVPDAEKKWDSEGVASCAGCHEKPTAIYERTGVTKFVKLDESHIWFTQDKHSKAVELIDPEKNPLAKQMCEKLQIADIHQAKECLSCHANWQYDERSDMWAQRPKFHQFGVSCESCHGAASGWLKPHTEPDWRKLTPQAKEDLGFVEVRNPEARAKQCLSCHIGDASQGKFVTHEMYAAGHPPLPGVELETFAGEMPPHWRHIHEKPDFDFRGDFIRANPSATAGRELYKSRSALISSVVAMQMSLDLVGAQVEEAKSLPDFATFDCYGCHHDLKSPSWRQTQQVVGAPGRPRPAVWPTTLVEAAISFAHAEEGDSAAATQRWQSALAKYQQAFTAQPFGHAAKLADARKSLSNELTTLLADLQKSPADRAAVERAFAKLSVPVKGQFLDFDAARQTAWALRILAQDLQRPLPEDFAADLHLTLPATQANSIADDLPKRLKALSEYDPEAFRRALEGLKEP